MSKPITKEYLASQVREMNEERERAFQKMVRERIAAIGSLQSQIDALVKRLGEERAALGKMSYEEIDVATLGGFE